MAVLIDSDILIEVTRGRDAAILEKWRALAESQQEILCSPVTVAEPSSIVAFVALVKVVVKVSSFSSVESLVMETLKVADVAPAGMEPVPSMTPV